MKYPFVKCENPRTVMNKHTGEFITVGCGVCAACLLNASRKRELLCSLQENDYNFCLFFTLTYSNENLPVMQPVFDKDSGCWLLYNKCSRLAPVDEVLGSVYYKISADVVRMVEERSLLEQYFGYPCLGYCSRRDVQLFMKRLRKYISKYGTKEKVQYYITAEYGPRTFRPHYHGLLYFNKQETVSTLSKLIRKAWSLGRVDSSMSRHKTSSYVAGYVNSTYSLPKIFTARSVRPFSLHSIRFGQKFYEGKSKEIYEQVDNGTFPYTRRVFGEELEVRPWRSFENAFFPKTVGYNKKSARQLYDAYVVLSKVVAAFGEGKTIEGYAKLIREVALEIDEGSLDYSEMSPSDRFLIQSIMDVMGEYSVSSSLSGITSILYSSRRFFKLCAKQKKSEYSMFKTIYKYYLMKSYVQLVDMYRAEVEYMHEYNDVNGLFFFYDNISGSRNVRMFFDSFSCDVGSFVELPNLKVYKDFVVRSKNDLRSSIKHKVQNDLNLILC